MKTLQHLMDKHEFNEKTRSPISLPLKRYELCILFKELGFTKGAEIGTDQGIYAENFCQFNPALELFCIDPWKVYETEVTDPLHDRQEVLTARFEETKKRLAPHSCKIIRKTSMEAVKDFEKESLDFVYIDGNHDFDHVLEDIQEWAKIVRSGGIVSGHDYGHYKHRDVGYHVTRAVNTYLAVNNIKRLFTFSKNRCSNWFFIKR